MKEDYCKCSNVSACKWNNPDGATFFCVICKQDHNMCSVVKNALLCGRILDHKGHHCSISNNITWLSPRLEKKVSALNAFFEKIQKNKRT
jgi:hypothetical protein